MDNLYTSIYWSINEGFRGHHVFVGFRCLSNMHISVSKEMVHSSFSFTSLGEKVLQHGQFSSLYIDHSTSCKTVFNFVRENIFVNWWEKGWIKPNNSHVGFHRFIGRERRFLNPQQSAMINIITVTKLLPIIDTCTVWSGIYNYDKITRIPGLIPKQCISYMYILYATVACWRLFYNPPSPNKFLVIRWSSDVCQISMCAPFNEWNKWWK